MPTYHFVETLKGNNYFIINKGVMPISSATVDDAVTNVYELDITPEEFDGLANQASTSSFVFDTMTQRVIAVPRTNMQNNTDTENN